jgi:hypothetical protein
MTPPNFQRGLDSMAAWCERWSIKINENKTRAIYFSHRRRPPDFLFTLNGRNIPFVNNVKYPGIIFDKKMTWRLHIEIIEAKGFRTFIILYSLFKSERLSANIKLTFHKTLISSVMTYACSAWEFAAETHLLKLQLLQNKVIRTIGKLPKRTPSAICIWLSKFRTFMSCRQQAEIQNHENRNVRYIEQGKPDIENIRGLNLAAGMCATVQVSRLPW